MVNIPWTNPHYLIFVTEDKRRHIAHIVPPDWLITPRARLLFGIAGPTLCNKEPGHHSEAYVPTREDGAVREVDAVPEGYKVCGQCVIAMKWLGRFFDDE